LVKWLSSKSLGAFVDISDISPRYDI